MAKAIEVKIGQTTFFVTKLNAFEALPVFGDLQKELLPALGALMSKDESADGTNGANLEAALAKLSENLDGKKLEKWVNRLLDDGHIAYEDDAGEAVAFKLQRDGHIFADFTEVLQLLVVVIKENFAAPLTQWLNRSGLADLAVKVKA